MQEGVVQGKASPTYVYVMHAMAELQAAGKALRLSDFDISPRTGFMPATPPLRRLPGDYFGPWEELMSRLPELNKSKQIRAEVHKLPDRNFNQFTLKSEEEWIRAYVMLCFLGQSYIWVEGQRGLVSTIPKKLAIPWCHVSDHLQMKPVICYASTLGFNFHLRDPHGPWKDDNFDITSTFTGTEDESWFYLVPMLVELAAVPALRAIEQIFDDMRHHRDAGIQTSLQTIQESLRNMTREISRMSEGCKPVTFYTEIRPYQAGSKGLDAFPDGIIYEGVDTNPRKYSGASAGQSSLIHAVDIFLGVSHSGAEREFFHTMRLHMPKKHRDFLAALERMPSVRDYCRDSRNADLITSYNNTVEEFAGFRSNHVILVARYIVNQQEHSVNPTLDKKGSGGTDFMEFLKKVRDMTRELLIKI